MPAWGSNAGGVADPTDVGAGVELAYQETTNDPATSSTSAGDVTGLTGITFTTGSTGRVLIIGHAQAYNTVATDGIIFTITDGTTEYARARYTAPTASAITELHTQQRWALTPNTAYTIKMQVQAVTGGVAHFVTSASAPKIVAYVQVLSC